MPLLTVAALYIDPRGPYPIMAGVECWGMPERDARLYPGPWPVVAHPPCGPWSHLRHLSRELTAECAFHAVEQVRRWGGVLEHPAHSKLWGAAALPMPGAGPDAWGGRTVEVCQVEWGHVARKRTWLYLIGVGEVPPPPYPGRQPTHWASGSKDAKRGGPPPGVKICSAEQRRRSPPEFAAMLVGLVRGVRSELSEAA